MIQIYFFVLLLAVMVFGQITPYTHMAPANTNFGAYGSYSKFSNLGPQRSYSGFLSDDLGINAQSAIHSSTFDSYYNQIQQRVEAYISPANTILADALTNFQICTKDHLVVQTPEPYNRCMSDYANKALRDISVLESKAQQPCNTSGN